MQKFLFNLLLCSLLWAGFSLSTLAQDEWGVSPSPNYPSISPRITYRNDSVGFYFSNKLRVPLTFFDVYRSVEYPVIQNAYRCFDDRSSAFRGMGRIYLENGKSSYDSWQGWYGLLDKPKVVEQARSLSLLKQLIEWRQSAELRLNANGGFVNAGNGMWNEIERLNTIDQQSKARREASEQQTECFGGSWANIGPFFNNTLSDADAQNFHKAQTPGIGRVAVLRKHPTQDILYMGAAGGGLWKSVANGADEPIGHRWQVVGAGAGDIFPTMGIADIAFNSSGSTMYVATGDRTRGLDALGQTSYSVGVLKSTDNGATWQRLANDVQWHILDNGTLKPINPIYTKIQRLLVLHTRL